jgi:hypothetical protein
MAKYEAPYEDTLDLYNQLIEKAGLSNYLNITILSDNKQKKIFTVKRCSESEKFKTGDDLNIVINQILLDQLQPEQIQIVMEESLAGVHYNTEKDKLELTTPDVITFSGVLAKYGFDKWNVMRESIITLQQAEKQTEDETEAITK